MSEPHSDPTLCTYRSKVCMNPRAHKRNGDLHKLCQEHRIKANENQRRMQQKAREKRRQMGAQVDSDPDNNGVLDDDEDVDAWGMLDEVEPLREPVTLRQEDLDALQVLFPPNGA